MVSLAISVEGQTEEHFVKKLLIPHLQNQAVYVTPILIGGAGGDVSFVRIRKDLNHLARSFDNVTTLYDFYGFKGKEASDDKESLEHKIVEVVAEKLQPKIIPYVQMYEFEGLLFSSPQAIEKEMGQRGIAGWAQRVLSQFGGNPELINDSPKTAPSKRLLQEADYLKTVHGPNIACEIGLVQLREKCAGFDDWLKKLETLNTPEA